jgi:Restriction endonuclease/HB1, ASXL, restriction endonuclease HTH domain
MGLAEIAEQVLRQAGGGPLHYREITERASSAGLMTPTGETPWASINAAMGVDNRRREARGELPRFVGAGSGYYRLRTAATEVEQAIERWNDGTKQELLVQLGEIDPGTFEELIGELLERIGFEDVEVTKRSGDGGIDVRGVLTVGGVTRVKTAIQVKRWANNVPDRIVRELRGSIGPAEQGLIITTSRFTKAAVKEAEMTDRAPVTLINGELLVELLAEFEIGVKRQSRPVLQLDETALAGGSGADDGDGAVVGTPGKTPPGMYRSLWPLPGGNQAYVTALEKLLPLAADQPTTTEFISRLQREFPQVESIATANGYIRVLVALGFVELTSGQISLTPAGREFVETQDIELVREALRVRVVGVQELLDELAQGARTMEQLQQVLGKVGLAWETNAQLGWRLHWLESVELVAADNGKYQLVQPVLPREDFSTPAPQQ